MSQYPHAERPYETLFICPPETPQATIDGLIEKIKAIISQEKGNFKTLQVWGRRRLTFPIKRQKDGLYLYFDFDAPGTVPPLLNNLFRVTDFVLRQMTVEREEAPVLPQRTQAFVEGSAERPAPAGVTDAAH